MRSILEKALIALLNEEKDTADALFHDFILERSRQIHESLRQGEDFILDESMENELAIDEMFGEADLSDGGEVWLESPLGEFFRMTSSAEAEKLIARNPGVQMSSQEEAEAAQGHGIEDEGDMAVYATAEEAEQNLSLDESDEEFSDEENVDGDDSAFGGEAEPETIEDRVSGLETELQSLAAEFDAMMNGEDEDEDGDDEEGDEFGGEEKPVEEGTVEIVAHNDGEIDITATTDDDGLATGMDMDMGMDAGFGGDDLGSDLGDDELSMEDFDDLSESAVDELEKVTVATGDGREQGNGKFKQNNQSIIKSHGVNDRAFKGTPVKINAKEHSGYAAEPAPSTKKLATSAKNVKSKGPEGQAGVKKEGDNAALLNKNSGEDKGAQSLIGSKKL